MSDRPIIFSAPMVRALLDGRKMQTRRLAWRIHNKRSLLRGQSFDGGKTFVAETPWQNAKIGDRLWVRENYARVGDSSDDIHACPDLRVHAYYAADSVQPECLRWRPSIHMPRWASRLTLTLTAVRVQRLQEISEADAVAEGADPVLVPPDGGSSPHKEGFADLWTILHGPAAWAANPFVVALSFTVERRNIDHD